MRQFNPYSAEAATTPCPTPPPALLPPPLASLAREQPGTRKSLERRLLPLYTSHVDVKQKIQFTDYLRPNERGVKAAQFHLKMTHPGLIISAGTERSLFDLILCALENGPELCLGLVVKDINPRVKAYIDFVVLLLRISHDCADFARLSSSSSARQEDLLDEISSRLDADTLMPPEVKAYYQAHLRDFAPIYYNNASEWKNCSRPVFLFYHREERYFSLLQSYARAGNIVAMTGSIEDLSFLPEISVVDLSNIPDYKILQLHMDQRLSDHPLTAIWTTVHPLSTEYHSCTYHPLTHKEREELDHLINLLFLTNSIEDSEQIGRRLRLLLRNGSIESDAFLGYNKETLAQLKKYHKCYLLQLPSLEWINLDPHHPHASAQQLNNLDEETLAQLVQQPELKDKAGALMAHWRTFNPSVQKSLSAPLNVKTILSKSST